MIKVYESTNNLILYHASEYELDKFDLSKSKEIGLHVGTKESALDRSRGFNKDFHLYQLSIKSSAKFMILDDEVYSWISPNVIRYIINNYPGIIEEDDYVKYRNKLADMDEYERSELIANIILNAGYSGIKYKNEIEDPGSISYIIVDESIIDDIIEIEL